MKKRLLSAALALAMVLTLLPLSAMPASAAAISGGVTFSAELTAAGWTDASSVPEEGASMTYHEAGKKDSNGIVYNVAGWYLANSANKKVYSTNGGVVGNMNAWTDGVTGVWYSNPDVATQHNMTTFKLIDAQSISGHTSGNLWDSTTSLNIDLNGKALTWSVTNLNKLSSLTITNSGDPASVTGSIIAGAPGAGKNLNVSLKNLTWSGAITIYNMSGSTVSLDGAGITNPITLTGTPATAGGSSSGGTVTLTNGATANDITITHLNSTVKNGTGGSVSLSGGSKCGKIYIDQTSGSNEVTLTGTGTSCTEIHLFETTGGTIKVDMGAACSGEIYLDATTNGKINMGSNVIGGTASSKSIKMWTNGGTIMAYNTTLTNAGVNMQGPNNTLDASNSTLGQVRVLGTDTHDSTKTGTAPKVYLRGHSTAYDIKPVSGTATGEVLTGEYTIELSGNSTVNETVEFPNTYANITVDSSTVTGLTKLGTGKLTLKGSPVQMGGAELGTATSAADVTMDVTNATNATISASINRATGSTNKIHLYIPESDTNNFRGIRLVDGMTTNYEQKTVKGGNFGLDVDKSYLASGIEYRFNANPQSGGKTSGYGYSYFYANAEGANKMVQKWQKIQTATPSVEPLVTFIDQKEADVQTAKTGGTANVFWLTDGGGDTTPNTVLMICSTGLQTFILPSTVNGQGSASAPLNWYRTDTGTTNQAVQLTGGSSYSIEGSVRFDLKTSNYTVTKINNVSVDMSPKNTEARGVTATLVGNTITLSGSVYGTSTVSIPLILDTDAGPVRISVAYNTNGKTGNFLEDMDPKTLNIVDSQKALLVANTNTRYPLNVSGIKDKPDGMEMGSAQIITTVGSTVPGTVEYRKQLGLAMSSNTSGDFNFADSPAINEAIGKVINGLNSSNFNRWITDTQTAAWKSIKTNTGTPTVNDLAKTGYDTLYFVPYLDVQVSQYNNNGTLTATFTPSYRLEVRQSVQTGTAATYKDAFKDENVWGAHVVQRGASLGALTSHMGEVTIQLPYDTGFALRAGSYAHQDDTYAYSATGVSGSKMQIKVNHASTKANNGLGTFTVGTVEPQIYLNNTGKNGATTSYWAMPTTGYYDTLQAAVDDVANEGSIEVKSGYTGNMPISVTGRADKLFYVNVRNNKQLSSTNASGTVRITGPVGQTWTVQLLKDTVVKPTEKPIPVTVASAVGGSASLSASRADEGDTITVTLTPAVNYRVGGVTVTAAVKNSTTGVTTNTTVITTAASANSWRFVVPTGATSVTVTPSFVATTNTNATVTVSNPAIGGTAATSAGNNQVAPGTPVTVTVNPASGYRTMGIYVTNAVATRTGANTFSFNVPSSTANVVVTPRFDRNNNTLFDDVWSYDYFSSAVAWAVGRGITNGDGSVYHFGTGKSCTREDMVTFLWRNAGSPIVTGVSNPFWDVQSGSYYYNAVMWAVKNGVTNGVSANQFGVGRAVTRGEAVTFLYRAAGSPAASANSGFYDVPSGAYYSKAVSWAVGKGITNGDGSTVRFNPNGYCLREQIVTFMYRNATGTRA